MTGIILVNKPVGLSSNKAVNIVKFAVGAKKCGHLGTLDLEAEGLLPVTVNSATKLFDFFLKKNKTYETVFQFGFETDTLDLSGKVTNSKACDVSLRDIEKVTQTLIGKQFQMPPQFSAKKVGGKTAYSQARKGVFVELTPKEIEIFGIKVIEEIEKNVFRFEISCSSGTYIRAIARDMAKLLDTYGVMKSLKRTKCGEFSIENSYTLEEIQKGHFDLIPCESLFDFESLKLDPVQETKILNGLCLDFHDRKDGIYKIFGKQFLGLGEIFNGQLKLSLRLF